MTYNRLDTTPAQKAGRISLAFATASLVILLLLHFVRPDLDPISRVLSEYSLGYSGWLGALWFFALALAVGALCYGLSKAVNSVLEMIGIGLLSLASVNLLLAGMFRMDSPGTLQPTASGIMHGIAGMVGISSLIVSSLILGWKLAKRPPWRLVRIPLIALALATLIADIGMTVAAASSGFGQHAGPSEVSFIGMWNRLLMIFFTAWVMTASASLSRKTTKI